jgi:hypothetical protein
MRGGIFTGILMWLSLAIMVGVGMFLVKYKVQALEDELIAKQEQIVRDRGAIRVLEAEWTYLNDPNRLRRLSAQHLGFGPSVPQNVTTLGALPMRDAAGARVDTPAPSTLPTGKLIRADAAPNVAQPAFERPAGLPVFLARLQRMLLPEAVGATTSYAVPR